MGNNGRQRVTGWRIATLIATPQAVWATNDAGEHLRAEYDLSFSNYMLIFAVSIAVAVGLTATAWAITGRRFPIEPAGLAAGALTMAAGIVVTMFHGATPGDAIYALAAITAATGAAFVEWQTTRNRQLPALGEELPNMVGEAR